MTGAWLVQPGVPSDSFSISPSSNPSRIGAAARGRRTYSAGAAAEVVAGVAAGATAGAAAGASAGVAAGVAAGAG